MQIRIEKKKRQIVSILLLSGITTENMQNLTHYCESITIF